MTLASQDSPKPAATISKRALYLGFFKLGAMSFGGSGPMTRHMAVEDRKWLDDQEFASLLGICQALPGANTCNFAVMIGDRFQGRWGSCAALAGLLSAPSILILILGSIYEQAAASSDVRAAVAGAGAAAAGLAIGAGLRMARALRLKGAFLLIAGLAFVAVGILRVSLPLTMAILLPLSWAATARADSP